MLLAIDIGNTDLVSGLHDGKDWKPQARHPSGQYLGAPAAIQQYLFAQQVSLEEVDQVILSSVVPGVTPFIRRFLAETWHDRLIVMGPRLFRKLPLGIIHPDEIGSDLVANATAGFARLGGPVVIVDFGTALTFTVVNAKGHIEGVTIAPGLKTAMQALFHNTAQLPAVPLELPTSAIGKSTPHALQAGIMLGYVGLVKELLDRMDAELGPQTRHIATGGLSQVLTPLHPRFDLIDRMLTLDGLRLIAQKFA